MKNMKNTVNNMSTLYGVRWLTAYCSDQLSLYTYVESLCYKHEANINGIFKKYH